MLWCENPKALSVFFWLKMTVQSQITINATSSQSDNAKNIIIIGSGPVVEKLAIRHVSYGVEDEHYATVGAALIKTLSQGLGEAFTEDVKAAWLTAYGVLSSTMVAAANVEPV